MRNHGEVKRGWATSRRLGIILGVLGLILVVAIAVLVRWGTRWTIPRASVEGSGYELLAHWDGAGLPSGPFERPIGIAVTPRGDLYVTDARKRVAHLSATGEVIGEWGREGDGPGEFSNPVGVAVAPDGSVFVSDYEQDRVQKFASDGRFLLEFGSSGSEPGQFNAPAGLAVDASGFVYVADFYNHRVQKFRFDGTFQSIIGHPGRLGDGALHYPTGVQVTPDGQLLVADAYNYQLQWFDREGHPLRRVGYHLFWLWPRPVSSRKGFSVPTGAAVGPDGLIHVADSGNHRIVMLSGEGKYLADWTIPDARPNVYSPEKVAVSPDGSTIYATDLAANRLLVLSIVHPGRSSGGGGKR